MTPHEQPCSDLIKVMTDAAVKAEKIENLTKEVAELAAAVRDQTKSLTDYPVIRSRVADMWKLVTGSIGVSVAATAAAVAAWLKVKGGN